MNKRKALFSWGCQGFFLCPLHSKSACALCRCGTCAGRSNLRSVQIKCCDLCGCAATNYLCRTEWRVWVLCNWSHFSQIAAHGMIEALPHVSTKAVKNIHKESHKLHTLWTQEATQASGTSKWHKPAAQGAAQENWPTWEYSLCLVPLWHLCRWGGA